MTVGYFKHQKHIGIFAVTDGRIGLCECVQTGAMRLGSDSLVLTHSKETCSMGFLSKSYNADLDVSLKVYSGYCYLRFGNFWSTCSWLTSLLIEMSSLQQQPAKIKLKMINTKLTGNDSSTCRMTE